MRPRGMHAKKPSIVVPTADCLTSPRMHPMPPSVSTSSDSKQHISTSDYGVRKNHPTAYDENPPFKGPLSLSDTSSPDLHRRRIRRHYLDEGNDLVLPVDDRLPLKVSSSTGTILKTIVDHLAYKDAPVDAKEVVESVEFYLRTGKRLIGAAKRVCINHNDGRSEGGAQITVHDLCSGHGLTGILFAACNPSRSKSSIPVRTILVDCFEPQSHAIVKDIIREVCPWISGDVVRFIPSTLDDFSSNDDDSYEDNGASLVISTHACGSLTDSVLEYAASVDSLQRPAAASVAVMPCCYTGTDKGAPYGIRRALGVSMAADVRRSFFLQDRGYHVDFATIPKEITPMNRIIVAERRK